MASITERNGRFMARIRRDGFKLVSKTFTRKQDAAAWSRRVEADMESGRRKDVDDAVPTLAEAIRLYRAGAASKLKGSETYAYWFDGLEASTLAAKRVNDITPLDLSLWRDAQESTGLKPGTVVRKLGLLSGLLTWCHKERGWLSVNPMRSVSKPRVSDERSRVLSDDEQRYLLAAAGAGRSVWLADVLVVLLRSAMRRSEIWGMKVADVDFALSIARLADTKNGTARDVPLCAQAAAALRRLVAGAEKRGDSALVPVSDPHAVSLAFRRALARALAKYRKDCAATGAAVDAGFLANVRLHDLRHCAVTTWASTGALSMPELMAISGHKSPRMLTRYCNLSASKVAEKMARLVA